MRYAALLLACALAAAACAQPAATTTTATSQRPRAVPLRANRAYDGAPPVVPHAIAALGRQDCLNCHKAGDAKTTEGDESSRTPHPELENCRQCHVEKKSDDLFGENTFRGSTYGLGIRQNTSSPWRIPHPLTLREQCVVCHTQVTMDPVVHTTHPERTNCTQCHVPAHADWPGPRPRGTPGRGDRIEARSTK